MTTAVRIRCASSITRRWHSFPGRWRVVRWLESQSARIAKLAPCRLRLSRDVRILVNPRDIDAHPLYIRGLDPRDRITRVLRTVLRPGDGMLDIGANLGTYSFAAANIVGASGTVHAFEASPEIGAALAGNLAQSRVPQITLHRCAVVDANREIRFRTASADHTGISSMRDLGSDTSREQVIKGIAIDSMLETLPTVHAIKMDIEGAEGLAIAGMTQLLQRDHPVIVMELTDTWLREMGSSAQGVCDTLRDVGYELFTLASDGLRPFSQAPTEQVNIVASRSWFDVQP